MAATTLFKSLMNELSSATTSNARVAALQKISKQFEARNAKREKWLTNEIQVAIESSNLMKILAITLKENIQWANDIPHWVYILPKKVYAEFEWKIPHEQTRAVAEILMDMFLIRECKKTLSLLSYLLFPRTNKLYFLNDECLYDIMRTATFSKNTDISNCALIPLGTATDNCIEWQHKILKDTPLILQVLSQKASENAWVVLLNISQHPDAKDLLPKEVLEEAHIHNFDQCTSVCAVLCNESSTDSLKLSSTSTYISHQATMLQKLLDIQTKEGELFRDNLLDLVLPLVNLSIMDANKDILGVQVISLLLQVVSLKECSKLKSNIAVCLQRGREEAAKTLWHLAFSEGNRKRIADLGGLQTLEKVHKETTDEVLKKNISGILFMFSKPEVSLTSSENKGHIMISYNWSHQATVFRLASSLKNLGYRVWLDVEQMKGSTLEAMAGAIESATLVLICMSQKYKDSPNCRLEGEYCVNRKVSFIPLMMQQNYRPDGWLGLILGSKLYHSFCDEENWDAKITALAKVLKSDNIQPPSSSPQSSTTSTTSTCPNSPRKETPEHSVAKDWTIEEVSSWLKDNKLGRHVDNFAALGVDGDVLVELKSLLESTQPILPFLQKLGIEDGIDALRITAALPTTSTFDLATSSLVTMEGTVFTRHA